MDLGNWDDDDFVTPTAGPPPQDDLDDLFEFTENLTIDDFPDTTEAESSKPELPPLPPGVIDLTNGQRGVLLERKTTVEGNPKPSKEEPFVELHYEGTLVATGEKFDSSKEQNYAMIVQLDIPPSGKSTVIRGLEIGLREVRAGEHVVLTVTSMYAYGKDGETDIPPDSDLRFDIEVLDVRATHKKVVVVDTSSKDLSRLETVRREREIAQIRREEEDQRKEAEKQRKAARAAAIREKLANKNKGGKKGGKKKK
ncbi:Peptidylprolyl isomerase [Gracilaria domingensis]|nr:Peptidylprolyl isomerase [Gracilaria domingensis]